MSKENDEIEESNYEDEDNDNDNDNDNEEEIENDELNSDNEDEVEVEDEDNDNDDEKNDEYLNSYDFIHNDDNIEYTESENLINIVQKENKISINRLTKYEMVRILGERTKQLSMGAKPLIKNFESLTYEKIAEEELKLNMIPFKIKRPLPNGKYEIWTIEELYKDHLIN
jgi:DNA-directed RNA polymerase subunit K/omega